jgi:phosphatidate phosphatase PAH1
MKVVVSALSGLISKKILNMKQTNMYPMFWQGNCVAQMVTQIRQNVEGL